MTVTIATGRQIAALAQVDNASAIQAAQFFIDEYRGATKKAYAEDLRQFFTFFDLIGVAIFDARRPHIIDFIDKLRHDGNGPATIKRKVSVLRCFYQYAIDEDHFDGKSPIPSNDKRLKLASVSRKSQTLGPDRDECMRLLAAARARSTRDYAIIRTLLHQGLRVSELTGLDVSDMRSERGHRVFHLSRKGYTEQDQAVSPAAASAIDGYLAGRTDGPLFCNEDGSRMTRYQIEYLVESLTKAASIPKRISPHSLRHACATQLLDEKMPVREVQVFMGHANSSTTERYDLGRKVLSASSPAYAWTF